MKLQFNFVKTYLILIAIYQYLQKYHIMVYNLQQKRTKDYNINSDKSKIYR